MNQEDLVAYLDEHKEEFRAHIRAKIMDSMTQQIQWNLPAKISEQVNDFYDKELRGEVNAYLLEQKTALKEAVAEACVTAAKAVAIALAERVQETLAPGNYKRDDLFKALLGVGRY